MKGSCIVFARAGVVDTGEIVIPEPGPGQLVTRTVVSAVSTGTETRVLRGGQDGTIFPLIPGYENVGEVVACGPETSLPIGSLVFVREHLYESPGLSRSWGGQVSHSLTSEAAAIPIPTSVPTGNSIFAKVSGISLHGVKRANVTRTDTVAVVGLGLIGHFVVQHALAVGAKVIAVDISHRRLALAAEAGASAVLNRTDCDVTDLVKRENNGGVTVAFDCTGRSDTLESTAALIRPRPWDSEPNQAGRLVIQGSLEEPVSIGYMELFRPELDVVVPRDCDRRDVEDALASMAAGSTDPSLVPARSFHFTDAATVYPQLIKGDFMRAHFSWD